MSEDDNVVSLPTPKRIRREKVAEYAEETSHVFSSLALIADITARVMKAVARELSDNDSRKRR